MRSPSQSDQLGKFERQSSVVDLYPKDYVEDQEKELYEDPRDSFWEVIALSFTKVFTPDSWKGPYSKKFNSEPLSLNSEQKKHKINHDLNLYHNNHRVRFTSFFGISNKCPRGVKPEWGHIHDNYIFTRNKLTGREIFNTVMSVFVVPLTFIHSMVKLFTEFPLCLFADLAAFAARRCKKYKKIAAGNKNLAAEIFWAASWGFVTFFLRSPLEIAHFAARAIISFVKGASVSYKEGKALGGPFPGAVFWVFNAAIFAAGATFLVPLIITAVGPALGLNLVQAGSVLSHVPVISQIGTWYNTLMYSSVVAVKTVIAPAPFLGAIGTLAGAGLPGIGCIFQWLYEKIDSRWNVASVKSKDELRQEQIKKESTRAKLIVEMPSQRNKNSISDTETRNEEKASRKEFGSRSSLQNNSSFSRGRSRSRSEESEEDSAEPERTRTPSPSGESYF